MHMDQTELQRRFGAAIRRRRLAARLGQEKLADQAGLHRTHISLLERGQGMPTLVVIHKVAVALGSSMAELMAEVEADASPANEPPEIPRGRPRRQARE
jgi:transcriptional regulator with XRE-family HTH domain